MIISYGTIMFYGYTKESRRAAHAAHVDFYVYNTKYVKEVIKKIGTDNP